MCHIPEQGFTSNELATTVGIAGRSVRRNTSTIYNIAYMDKSFYDKYGVHSCLKTKWVTHLFPV